MARNANCAGLGRLLLAGCILSLLVATPAAQAKDCDARCLEAMVQRFLDQLPRHDPAGLPFSPSVRALQNAVPTAPGSGVWQQVSAVRSRTVAADPSTGNVVAFAAVDVADAPAAILVRLKVQGGKITESEIIFNARTSAFSNPVNLREPDLIYGAAVPAARRSSRDQLVDIVKRYADGISRHDGSQVPFSYRCDRYASGAKVTNSPDHPADKEGGTCAGSMLHLTGQAVANLRIAVVDVQQGLVVAYFIVTHPERTPPAGTYVGEFFKIVDGQIRSIEEFSYGGGWPPDSGFASVE